MVDTLGRILDALNHPIRRAVVQHLATQETPFYGAMLCERFNVSSTAMTKHMRVLESAGIITRLQQGRAKVTVLNRAVLRDVIRAIDTWASRPVLQGPAYRTEHSRRLIQLILDGRVDLLPSAFVWKHVFPGHKFWAAQEAAGELSAEARERLESMLRNE